MDKHQYINKIVKQRYDYLVEHGYNVMAVFLQGSQNYNLDIYTKEYTSDIDVKAIVLPSLDDIVMNKKPISTTIILDNNEHIEVKDIRIMIDMFIKQNISYIELLYTNFYVVNPTYQLEINELLKNRDKIANINFNQFLRCVVGMSMEKLKALEHPYPTIKDKIDKYGYDPKQLHHIMRLNNFLVKLLVEKRPMEECYQTTGKTRDELIEIKKGRCNLDSARKLSILYHDSNKKLKEENLLKEEKIDYETINDLKNYVSHVIKKTFLIELQGDNK